MKNYEELPINDVIQLAKENDRAAFFYIKEKFQGIIHGTIKKKNYFLQNGDYDDLFQEGLVGIYKAVKDFKETIQDENGKDKKTDFETFLKKCINRQLISAIKFSTRKKHSLLNDMVPLDRTLPENDNLSNMDIICARSDVQYGLDFEFLDPEQKLIITETRENEIRMLDEFMSQKEKRINEAYQEGKAYKEIVEELELDNPKEIDNAIQRVKRKIDIIRISTSYHDDFPQPKTAPSTKKTSPSNITKK